MYSVAVYEEIFIAHSLSHKGFGPAQNIHGATLGLSIEVFSTHLDEMNTVIDLGKLLELVEEIKEHLNYKNLDEMPEFDEVLTTIDYLSNYVWLRLRDGMLASGIILGEHGLHSMKVRIDESRAAWATYEKDFSS